MKELSGDASPDVFTRKWLLLVLLCMMPAFFLFVIAGDPGRGRAAALAVGISMTAFRACWDLRKHAWFWATGATLVAIHVLLVLLIPWNDKSYPGYALLPLALLDYGIIYGCFKLVEKVTKPSHEASSST